jgi:hypothetical protein
MWASITVAIISDAPCGNPNSCIGNELLVLAIVELLTDTMSEEGVNPPWEMMPIVK